MPVHVKGVRVRRSSSRVEDRVLADDQRGPIGELAALTASAAADRSLSSPATWTTAAVLASGERHGTGARSA